MQADVETFRLADGSEIVARAWQPEGTPHAVLLVVHGLAEHGGRYEDFAAFFNAAGYAVVAADLPGHGRSGGHRAHVRTFGEFIDAVRGSLALAQARFPDVPLVLVGHSMGGLIAANFLVEDQQAFAAAVLSGPAIRAPEQPNRFAMFIMRLLSRLFPKLGVMQIEADGVSRDPEVVRRYLDDPLVFTGKVSARLAAELFKAMQAIDANAAKITLPTLVMHGGEDILTSVDGSRAFHAAISSSDKELVILDGLYHEIFNEPERVEVMTRMRAWLDTRVAADEERKQA